MIHFNLMVHNVSPKEFQMKTVNDIIYNENKRIVSVFKDHLIFNDPAEFLRYYYDFPESADIITKWGLFFHENDLIPLTPNYAIFDWKKLFLKNMQKKFKLREKLIANFNQDNDGESNKNETNEEDADLQFKNLKINDSNSNQNEKTFTRILDPKLFESEISHNKTILIGNHKDIKLFNSENQAIEIFNSSNNNECTLILDSNSIINNSFFNHKKNKNSNYKTIGDSSILLGRKFDRNITPISYSIDKSSFYNQNNTFNLIDINNEQLISSDKNILGDKFIFESSKSIKFEKYELTRNMNRINNEIINDRFIFTSGNNNEHFRPNSSSAANHFDNLDENNNQNNFNSYLKKIDYKELFGDENKIVESIILNEENNDLDNKNEENNCLSKYEEMDSLNKNSNDNFFNLHKIEETKSIGDINLLTTNENMFKFKAGKESNPLLKSDNLKESKKGNLFETVMIKLNKHEKENIDFETLNTQAKEKQNINNRHLIALESDLDDFNTDAKIKPGFNDKMNFNKKFNFNLNKNKHGVEFLNGDSERVPFNTLICKSKNKIDSFTDEKSLSVRKKKIDKNNNSDSNQTPNKNDINTELKGYLAKKKDMNNLTFDMNSNSKQKKNLNRNENEFYSHKKHKKSQSNPNIKQLSSSKKLYFSRNDLKKHSKATNSIIKKTIIYNHSKESKNYKKSIHSGMIPLNEYKRRNNINSSKNTLDKSENQKSNDKKLLISYVEFNKENNKISKADINKSNETNLNNVVEKKNYEVLNDILNNNNNNNNTKNTILAKQPIMKNLNYIDENALENNNNLSSKENKNKKSETLTANKQNFSNFMDKINNIFNSQAELNKLANNKKSMADSALVKNSILAGKPLKRFISDECKVGSRKINFNEDMKRFDGGKEEKLDFINHSLDKNKAKSENLLKDIEHEVYRSIETEYQFNRVNSNELPNTPFNRIKNKFFQSVDFLRKINQNKNYYHAESIKKQSSNKKNSELKIQENQNNFPFSNNNLKLFTFRNKKEEQNPININVEINNSKAVLNNLNSEIIKSNISALKKIQGNKSNSFRDNTIANFNDKQIDQIKSYLDENINSIKHKQVSNSISNPKNYQTLKQAKIIENDSKHILSDSFINMDLSQEYLKKYSSENNIDLTDKKEVIDNQRNFDLNSISKNLYNNSLHKFIEKNYYLNSIKRNSKNSQINNSSANLNMNKNKYSEILRNKSVDEQTISVNKQLGLNENKSKEETFLNSIYEKKLNNTVEMENSIPKGLAPKNPNNSKSHQKFNLNFQAFNSNNNNTSQKNAFIKFNNEKNKVLNLNCFSNRNKENPNNHLFNKIIDSNNHNYLEKSNNIIKTNNYLTQNFNSQSTKNNEKSKFGIQNLNNIINNTNNNSNDNKYIKIFVNNLKDKSKTVKKNTINSSSKKDLKSKPFSIIKNSANNKQNKIKNEELNSIYNFKNNLKYTSIIKKYRSIESTHNSHRNDADKIQSNRALVYKTNLSKSKENSLYNSQSIELDRSDLINFNRKDILSDKDPSHNNTKIFNKENSWMINPNKNNYVNSAQNLNCNEDSASVSQYNKSGFNIENINNSEQQIFKEKLIDISDCSKSVINKQNTLKSEIVNLENIKSSNKNELNKFSNKEENYTFRENKNGEKVINESVINYIVEKSSENFADDINNKITNYNENNNDYNEMQTKNDLTPIQYGADFINDNLSKIQMNYNNHLDSKKINHKNIKKLNLNKINENENSSTLKNINSIRKIESNRSQKLNNKYKNNLKDKIHNFNTNRDLFSNVNTIKPKKETSVKQSEKVFNSNRDARNFSIKPSNSPLKNNAIHKIFLSSNKNQEITNLGDFKQFFKSNNNTDFEKSLESVDQTFKTNKEKTFADVNELNRTHQPNNPNDRFDKNSKNNLNLFTNRNSDVKSLFKHRNSSRKEKLNELNFIKIRKNPKKFDVLSLLNNTGPSNAKTKNDFYNKLNDTPFNVNYENNLSHLATSRQQKKPIVNLVKNYTDEAHNQNNNNDNFENYNVLFTDTEIIDDRYKLNHRNSNINQNNDTFSNHEPINFRRGESFISNLNKNNGIVNDKSYYPPSNNKASNANLFYESGNFRNELNRTSNVNDNNLTNENLKSNFNSPINGNFNKNDRIADASNRESNILNANKVLGILNNLNSKNTSSRSKLPTTNPNLDNNINNYDLKKKVPNLNLNKIQNQGLKKNHPYSQSLKNLPNNNNNLINNNGISSNLIDKYTYISPLYKNIYKTKENEFVTSNKSNFNHPLNNHQNKVNYLVNKIIPNNKNKGESNRVSNINKKVPNLDFKQFFDNTSVLFDSATSKNITNTNKILGYTPASNRPLTNKNIQINNNIIINNGDSLPLTMNFNYDYNGKIFVENKNNTSNINTANGNKEFNYLDNQENYNSYGINNQQNIHPFGNEVKPEFYLYGNNNPMQNNSSKVNFVGNNSARYTDNNNNNVYFIKGKDGYGNKYNY